MDDGHIVVDAVEPISVADISYDLARESGFESVKDLLRVARHGRGDNVYLIRFHYLPPGAWDMRYEKPGSQYRADIPSVATGRQGKKRKA